MLDPTIFEKTDMLDPTVYKDWQIAENAEKKLIDACLRHFE